MQSNEKENFYFQGRFFEKEKEMWDYAKEWRNLPLDQESAERNLKTLEKEIVMNIFLRGIHITNNDFRNILNKILMFTINEIDKISQKKDQK